MTNDQMRTAALNTLSELADQALDETIRLSAATSILSFTQPDADFSGEFDRMKHEIAAEVITAMRGIGVVR